MYLEFISIITFQLEGMTSSFDSLRDLLMNLLGENFNAQGYHGKDADYNKFDEAHWTPEKIAQMLNINAGRSAPFEGNIQSKLFAGKDFFAFDSHMIQMAPKCK